MTRDILFDPPQTGPKGILLNKGTHLVGSTDRNCV